MQTHKTIVILLLLLTFFVSACSIAPAIPAETKGMEIQITRTVMEENTPTTIKDMNTDALMETKTPEPMTGKGDDTEMTESKNQDVMMEEESSDEMNLTMDDGSLADDMSEMTVSPAWLSAALRNVKTGETFSIEEYKGRVVLVETLAMWCSNCLRQQTQVQDLHALVGEHADFVSLGLDIDPNEEAEMLKGYTERNGFDWLYAISPQLVSRDIGNKYGEQFLNPTSTPMLIVDRHGEVHTLRFGIKSAEELYAILEPFLEPNM
jgi:hypothetical protein